MITIPLWLWLLVLLPMHSILTIGFVLAAGVIQGLVTGRYPSLSQWSTVLHDLQQPIVQGTGSSSMQDDEPVASTPLPTT